MNKNYKQLLSTDAVTAAHNLLGWRIFVRQPDDELVGGLILETEAYMPHDAASHTYNGRTARNNTMFMSAGHIYVYFTYGMHWCMNFVTGPEGVGQGVLIRAIELTKGIAIARHRRNNRPPTELTNGPAKVCQALGVTDQDNGLKLNNSRFLLTPPTEDLTPYIKATKRIGIKKDTDRLWRFIVNR